MPKPASPANTPIQSLGTWIDAAIESGQLPDPGRPLGKDYASFNQANSEAYIRALRSRLISLGYLKDDAATRDKGELDDALSGAIASFQKEAAFTGADLDKWAGPETKRRLQQLVSFEEEQDTQQWEWTGKLSVQNVPAIRRAVYLRLYTLGCISPGNFVTPQTNFNPDTNPIFAAGINTFITIARQLRLINTAAMPSGITRDLLGYLYAHDRLIAAVATHLNDARGSSLNEHFLFSLGRIELWLLGYRGFRIDRPSKLVQTGSVPTAVRPEIRRPILEEPELVALREFWRANTHGQASIDPNGKFGKNFFKEVLEIGQSGESDERAVAQAIELVRSHPNSILDQLKALASAIWDGIKRAIGWIARVVRSTLDTVAEGVLNAARILAATARKCFEGVVRSFEIVGRQFNGYLDIEVVTGSDSLVSMEWSRGGFDTFLYLDQEAGKASSREIAELTALKVRLFDCAVKILAALVKIVETIISSMALISSVLLALVALAKGWDSVRVLIKNSELLTAKWQPMGLVRLNPVT